MITLKVPFKKGWRYKEKELFFAFNIGALEYATEKLGIELWEIGDYLSKPGDFNSAYDLEVLILHGAYLMGCLKSKQHPKHELIHAVMWTEYMKASEKKKMTEELGKVFGKMAKSAKGSKKKTTK